MNGKFFTGHLIPLALWLLLSPPALLLRAAPGQGSQPVSGEEYFKLRNLIDIAVAANPEVQAAAERIAGASYRVSATSGWPDPVLRYTYFAENVETRLGPQTSILSFVQPIPFPGKLSQKEKVESYGVRILEEDYQETRLRIEREVKETFFSIASINKIAVILEEEIALLARLVNIALTRVETGEAGDRDVLKLKLEKTRIEEKILNYRKRSNSLHAFMNSLLDRDPRQPVKIPPIGRPPELKAELEDLEKAILNRPRIRRGELRIKQGRESLSLSRKSYLPDFTLGIGYIWIGDARMPVPDSGRNAWNVSLGLRIPLWFGKVGSDVEEKKSSIRYSELSLENIKAETLARLEDLYSSYLISRDIIDLYNDNLIPMAEQSLRSAKEGYINGKVDIIDLLDNERMLLQLRIALAERTAEAERSIAALEEHIAMDLVER